MSEVNPLIEHIDAGTPWVLLVDDDRNILDTAKDILEEAKFVVVTAGTGAQALSEIERKAFNVVVVDFQLPDLSGLELARKIREQNADTCVILMTGHASLEMAVKAIQEAVYDYLIKPVDPAQLQRTIEKALEKQRLALENKQLIQDLRAVNEATRRLDSLKSKMLKVLSHDMRTPLSSIRGYSELLKSGVKGRLTDAQKQTLDITIQEADHINGLISDLLDLAQIEAGHLSLDRHLVNFGEIMQKVLPRSKFVSEMKEVSIDVTLPSPSVPLQVDMARMVQIFSNLLRNALKNAPRGGRVFLNAAVKDGQLEVRISHAGTGLPPDQLKSIFEWSSISVPGPQGTQQDGLRLGLAIAREIVHAHGGEIGVESAGLDQGNTYWVRLPIAKGSEQESGEQASGGRP
jgi:signal transduction histidine kinase